MSSLRKSASMNEFWKQSFPFKTSLSLMTLIQESSHLVTLEKNRFPSGSTVSREELIVFKAPFVLWIMVNDHFLYSGEWRRIIGLFTDYFPPWNGVIIRFILNIAVVSIIFKIAPHEVRDVYGVVSAQGIKVTSSLKTSVIKCHHQYHHRCTVCGEINK